MIPWRHLIAIALLSFCACTKPRAPLGEFNLVPEFQLTSQSGEAFFSKAELSGHVWIADFIFTNCQGPCPRMGSQMRQVQRELLAEPGIRFVSFTVDPVRDTPEVLAAYAKRFSAQPGRWFFLTGPKETLNKLSLDVFMLAKLTGQFDHSTRFTLIDQQGRVRKYYDSTGPENITELIADARELARSGKP